MSKRLKFDDLLTEVSNLGYHTWESLTAKNRTRLIRLYFEEHGEWGDALYENMAHVFDAFEHHDDADFGLAVRQKMTAYVMPYVNKKLLAHRREQEEVSA